MFHLSITYKCGYLTFCSSCLTNLKITNKCPLCRKKIQKNSLTFVSIQE